MHVRRYCCTTCFGNAIMLTVLSFSNCLHSQLICRSHSSPISIYNTGLIIPVVQLPASYRMHIIFTTECIFKSRVVYAYDTVQSISKYLIRKYSFFLHQQSLKFHYLPLCMDQEHVVPKLPCDVANLFVKAQHCRKSQQHCLLIEL